MVGWRMSEIFRLAILFSLYPVGNSLFRLPSVMNAVYCRSKKFTTKYGSSSFVRISHWTGNQMMAWADRTGENRSWMQSRGRIGERQICIHQTMIVKAKKTNVFIIRYAVLRLYFFVRNNSRLKVSGWNELRGEKLKVQQSVLFTQLFWMNRLEKLLSKIFYLWFVYAWTLIKDRAWLCGFSIR